MKLTLSIKTDQPMAELGLFTGLVELDHINWYANLELAETIHIKILGLLKRNNLRLQDVNRIIFYKGPGSFTGLRIGASVANALGLSLGVKVVGSDGNNWPDDALDNDEQLGSVVVPKYGEPAKTTNPRMAD